MPVTSIRYISAPVRPTPKIGDRQVTKKHGLRIRIPETHNGMRVVAHGRPCYVWCKPADLPPLYRHYLTAEECAALAPATEGA